MKHSILVVNGPNLNMLGMREPEIYGTQTLADIEHACAAHAREHDFLLHWFQSNDEGALIDRLHQAHADKISGIIINAGAYTHTSIAILDALSVLACPIIEVHLSNIYKREPFRHHSFVSKVAHGVLCGFGADGYTMALDAMKRLLNA